MKIYSWITPVLLALLPVAAAQDDCFCPGGASVPDRNKVIQLSSSTQTTCGSLQDESSKSYLVRTYGCNYYRYYGHLCGCEEFEEPIQVCQLCQDDQDLAVGVQKSAESGSESQCQDYAMEAKYDPFQQGCGYYNFLGSVCGCVKNRPPFEGCTLCADGNDPPLASQQVDVPGVEGGTCEHVNFFIRYVQEPETVECTSFQATLGTYCGCDHESQPEGGCPLCMEEGLTLSDEPAPEFNYLSKNGKTQIYQTGKSCLQAEMLAHDMAEADGGETTCSLIREQLSAACCKGAETATSLEPATSLEQGAEETSEEPEDDDSRAFARSGRSAAAIAATILGLGQLLC